MASDSEGDWLDESHDVVTESAALALHGLFDAPGPAPTRGAILPPLWHWLAFLPRVPQSQLGLDGHPKRPANDNFAIFPQRMFAGARINVLGSALVASPLTRRKRVESIVEKSGKNGRLLFVTEKSVIESDGVVVIEEIQDIAYLSTSPRAESAALHQGENEAINWPWALDLTTDSSLLFRFSALTFNAHRIHYDLPYARDIEGFPGLVVHGPLQAVGLAEICRRNAPADVVTSFNFRAIRPMLSGGTLHLRGRRRGSEVELIAFDDAGLTTITATAVLASL